MVVVCVCGGGGGNIHAKIVCRGVTSRTLPLLLIFTVLDRNAGLSGVVAKTGKPLLSSVKGWLSGVFAVTEPTSGGDAVPTSRSLSKAVKMTYVPSATTMDVLIAAMARSRSRRTTVVEETDGRKHIRGT